MKKIIFKPTNNNVGCYVQTNLKSLNKDDIRQLKKSLDSFGVLFFKEQNLTPEEYMNFSSHFGSPAEYPMLKPHNKFKRRNNDLFVEVDDVFGITIFIFVSSCVIDSAISISISLTFLASLLNTSCR